MKVLVVGSGGREHALAWKIAQTPGVETWVAPGNDGIRMEPNLRSVDISATDYERLVPFAVHEKFDFVVVGSDQQLADGLVDKLGAHGIAAFGPTQAAAKIEYSKAFAKQVMQSAKIPTARFQVFHDASTAKNFLRSCGWKSGWALKADGLALGKGVVVTENPKEADATIDEFMVAGSLGDAGKTLVIEERLQGREVSAFYFCDGNSAMELAYACDHKQLYDGGKGPNTGGMGAYSPAVWLDPSARMEIERRVVAPLLQEMQARGKPFRGMLFIGLMITEDGPQVIEFNARFGDPETQAMLPLVDGDFLGALRASAAGDLGRFSRASLRLKPMASVHVVLAAHGYPGGGGTTVRKGDVVTVNPNLLPGAKGDPHVKLFFAGVKKNSGTLVTNGGRVLGITAVAKDLAAARELAYKEIRGIEFLGMQLRRDVGAS